MKGCQKRRTPGRRSIAGRLDAAVRLVRAPTTGRPWLGVALAGAMLGAPSAAALAQPVTDRSPNLAGTWVTSPRNLHFQFSHRFQVVGEDADIADLFDEGVLVNYPTMSLVYGVASGVNAGVRYSSSSLVAAQANEWQPYVKWAPIPRLGEDGRISLALTGAWNSATESLDGEITAQTEVGPLILIGSMKGFTDVFDLPAGAADEALALAGGIGVRLNRYVTLAVDAADLVVGVHAPAAWSAGLQIGIPYTPHTFSLLATNVTSGTLEGTVTGVTNTVFWGFEFTVPFSGFARWGQIFEPEEEDGPEVPAGGRGAGDTRPARQEAGRDTARAPGARAPSGRVVEVAIREFGFEPASVSVPAGTTIRWINRDPVAHTVTGESGEWGSALLGPGETFEFIASEPGAYAYNCTPHPFMEGVVRVTSGG